MIFKLILQKSILDIKSKRLLVKLLGSFLKKIHAVTIEGFQLKVFAFVLAFAVCKFFQI